ncbi:hypothetical protein [Streptomyces sp. MJP52]|uniref:hypothetical protein n=1 Tax=Streptomyces sp. MJP52 TaxID=2940555 RepID=UPI0024767FBD|nr:hypothetical protein [Streptomyces sp. MJP52]MDH6223662.1 hypothetical protein [Streptomyces sp. MJP52]
MRRLIALGSLTGAPGVTTAALALASCWPHVASDGRPVVVEANVWGGDLATRCGVPHSPGLLDVAATARQPHPGSLLGAVAELPCGVRAVLAPAGRPACREAVRVLAGEQGRAVLTGGEGDRGTVLLDLGRLGEHSDELVAAADHILLVTTGTPEALTHVRAHLLATRAAPSWATVVVVGPCPYSGQEIAQALDVERVWHLPWDPKTVSSFAARRAIPPPSRFRTPPLMAASLELARRIAASLPSGEQQPKDLPGQLRSAVAERRTTA